MWRLNQGQQVYIPQVFNSQQPKLCRELLRQRLLWLWRPCQHLICQAARTHVRLPQRQHSCMQLRLPWSYHFQWDSMSCLVHISFPSWLPRLILSAVGAGSTRGMFQVQLNCAEGTSPAPWM